MIESASNGTGGARRSVVLSLAALPGERTGWLPPPLAGEAALSAERAALGGGEACEDFAPPPLGAPPPRGGGGIWLSGGGGSGALCGAGARAGCPPPGSVG